MRRTLFSLLVGVSVVGCTDSGSSDPCDDATSGTVCRWAGTGEKGFNALNPTAHRLESKLYNAMDVTFGADGRGYIVDWNNHRIRRVDLDGSLVTILGNDVEGDGAPNEEDRLPECAPAGALGADVSMNHPTDAEFGPDGKLYISAWHNNKIRVVDVDTTMTYTLVGDNYGFSGDGGPSCRALFNQPKTVVFGPDGTIYTIDQRNGRIRTLSPGALEEKEVITIAGSGALGNAGDGGQAKEAEFGFEQTATPRPSGALLLKDRNLFVADSMNNRIRRINLDTGIIDCIAGNSALPGYSGDGGQAIDAQLNFPLDLEWGPDGRMYVADRYNHAIRAIDLDTGIIETVVGTGNKCSTKDEDCAERATATTIDLNEPYGIAFDPKGDLYVADTHNSRILKVIQ
jgi:sugar lactone lactonase YvrE